MVPQVFGTHRLSTLLQVRRRCAQQRRRSAEQAIRHRSVGWQSRANGNVPAFTRNCGVHRHFQRHIRKALQKSWHERSQQDTSIRRVRYDAERTCDRTVQFRDHRTRGVRLLEQALCIRVNKTPGRREPDAPRCSLKDARAERLFKIRHSAAHCGLGHAERAGCGRKAVEIHDLGQYGKLGGHPDEIHDGFNLPESVPYCFT